jgi:hypothetical protein
MLQMGIFEAENDEEEMLKEWSLERQNNPID